MPSIKGIVAIRLLGLLLTATSPFLPNVIGRVPVSLWWPQNFFFFAVVYSDGLLVQSLVLVQLCGGGISWFGCADGRGSVATNCHSTVSGVLKKEV